MRILVATRYRGIVGGVETLLREVLPGLAARGHEIALLYEQHAAPSQAAVDENLPGIPTWQVDSLSTTLDIQAWRPNVVFSHGLENPAMEESLLDRFPTVLFAHNYHGTCISGTKRFALPTPQPCSRRLGPACLLAYCPRRCGGLNPLTMLRLYRVQRRRQGLLPCYRGVVVASTHMREEYRRHGIVEERLHLAPLFPTDQVLNAEPPDPQVLTGRVILIGRLTDLKGGSFLVEALRLARERLVRPLTLVVAGDGPERETLAQQACAADIPAEFHGWVDAERRTELMRSADILAVPSVWPEPFGLVGVEAGCVGLPAVGFQVGGIPDWLRPGISGELAPGTPPSAAGLSDAIVRALSDPGHRERLRRGAWTVAQGFTKERHLEIVECVLRRACLQGHEDNCNDERTVKV